MLQAVEKLVRCTVCGSTDLEECLPLGRQPLSTHFENAPASSVAVEKCELSFGFCNRCATIQLVKRFPLAMLQCKSPAVEFREPEAHLTSVVERLVDLHIVNQHTEVLGISYIDDDLLNALSSRIGINANRMDFSLFPAWQKGFGLETMQSIVSSASGAERINKAMPKVDVVCARFILEHAESGLALLQGLRRLVRPGGYLVIEVPDIKKMMANENYALIWEDHFTYFSVDSLSLLAAIAGTSVVDIKKFANAYEDTLSAILKVNNESKNYSHPVVGSEHIASTASAVRLFAQSFNARKASLSTELDELLAKGERIAIFGAGHHSAKLINFFDIANKIDFVVDNNPEKIGRYMPGTDIIIHDSQFLIDSEVTTCISMLTPETEIKVQQSLAKFFCRGGKFMPVLSVIGVDRVN